MQKHILKKLQLYQFKGYSDIELSFRTNFVCFLGKNGSGKTNLLDAIHSLSLCKSYFSSLDQNSIQFNKEQGSVIGSYLVNEEEVKIAYQLFKSKKKNVSKNGKNYDRLADHIGYLPLVVVTPYDVDLIREGSEVRRKWLDQCLSQTNSSYLDALIQYNKILEQRNALLKNQRMHITDVRDLVLVYDNKLIDYGNLIHGIRKQFFIQFTPIFNSIFEQIGETNENAQLTYESELSNNSFKELLESSLQKDIYAERTTVGIHKDDIAFELQSQTVKKFASQGQQKTFLLGMKLAQFEYTKLMLQKEPFLLLDDIAEKLDEFRLKALFSWISKHTQTQVFLSDTDVERIPKVLSELWVSFERIIIEHHLPTHHEKH
jgi:DNA replication and repair protein RecF